ncbi:MAG: biotin transporter BioY [Acutalibacteraceae bacterium]
MKSNTAARGKAMTAAVCALSCALIILGAFIKIPLPMISITLQLEFVILSATLIGARRSSLSVAAYIILGLCGVPVFTYGGGIACVLKPSFGFIIGFLAAAALTGYITEHLKKRSFWRLYLAAMAGTVVIYLIGTVYFYFVTKLYLGTYPGFMKMLSVCVFTTFPKDAVFCLLIAFIAQRVRPAIGKYLTR